MADDNAKDIKIAIVITGILSEMFLVEKLIQTYHKIPYLKIVSTWSNANPQMLYMLSNNGFNVVLTDPLSSDEPHPNNQIISIRNGVRKAQELGCDYVFRSRVDICSSQDNDIHRYIEIVKHNQKLTFLSWIRPVDIIYFFDVIIYGKSDDFLKMYIPQQSGDPRFIEWYLMETFIQKQNLTLEDVNEHFSFSLDDCITNHIDFHWYRPPDKIILTLQNANRNPKYKKLIEEYCCREWPMYTR